MAPFKVVNDRETPPIIQASTYPSKVESVNVMIEERDGILDELRANIFKAQHHMKQQVHKKRRDLQFQVGDLVYMKAQPYRMCSLAHRRKVGSTILWSLSALGQSG